MTLPQLKDLQSYSTRPEMTRGLVTLLAQLHRHKEMIMPTNKLRHINVLRREGGFVVGEPMMPLKDWVEQGWWLVWGIHC